MDKRIKKKRLAVILVYYYLFILNNIKFRLRFDRYTDELFIEDTQDCNSPVRKKIKIIDGIKKDNTYKDLNDYSLIIIFDSKHNLFFDRQSNKLKGFSPESFSIDNENGKEELSINFSEKKK